MSSTPNKRSYEESGNGSGSHGHSSASKYQNEDSGTFPGVGVKIPSSTPSEYHAAYDMGQDSRMPKVPRTESRDSDRRSPLLPTFRVSSSSNDSLSDHPAGFENRLEFRDSKDNNRDPKFENRDAKVESRDLYQGSKVDKDVKFESRGDDSKESKYERDNYSEHRGDLKMDKDGYGGVSVHSNWKEAKEQHRGKRYPDASGGSVDPWHTSRSNLHIPSEGGKETSNVEEKDYAETCEAVGENKVDMKGEDKFKDKDRKRKEGKHREWGERDKDRNDRRNSLQLGSNSTENKDPVKEEREAERWEKERKDLSRDKDKVNYRGEKDYVKKESGSGTEKEGSHNDKELVDVPGRTTEPENSTLELKKPKENDGCKNADRDPRDRKKDRDVDLEGEKLDKRNRHHDKESDEGCGDAEGGTEREREAFGYGVQQRKRMLRPRGSPQLSNRDPRFRSRNHENEGSQVAGKPDVSTVVYRVGECMQDLIRLWKEYESSQADKTAESSQSGPTLEIRIPAEHVSATNRQVRGGQLWGTDIYTDDSDLVAVLMHTGYCRPTASPPPATIQELRATIRVLPPQDCYISTLRNNVRSRAWGAAIGCSYRVELCCIVKKGGGTIDLEPCLTHSSTLEPTLAPVAVERTMTTRAAASNALRQQRFVREVTIQFNLCNEPWLKYSISVIADKGLKKPLYTSSRLKKGEVLYLETHSRRYELSFSGEKMVKAGIASQALEAEIERSQTHNLHATNGDKGAVDGDTIVIDVFRWSRCKNPLPQKLMRSIGMPLPLEHVEVVEDNLEWEDIRWSSTGVWIAGIEYPLARAHFLSPN